MVQNKHLHGSKQTLIWFKTNTYMVQNKHLYGAVQHDCVLFNSYMFRPQSIIIRPQEQYLKKKVKMQCKICYRVYRAGAILKMPYCVISLSLSLSLCGATVHSGPGRPHYRSFTIELRHPTSGRTPLGQWSVRGRDLYLITHDTHKRQASMPPVGFEPTTLASERPQTPSLRPRSHWHRLPSVVTIQNGVFTKWKPCLHGAVAMLSWSGTVYMALLPCCHDQVQSTFSLRSASADNCLKT